MVRAEVVHDDDVACTERGDEDLIEVREKGIAVHRAIEQAGRGDAVHPQGCDTGAGVPVLVRRVIMHALAAEAAPVSANPIGRDAAFIKEHKSFRRNGRRHDSPRITRGDDVGASLFGRAYRFF